VPHVSKPRIIKSSEKHLLLATRAHAGGPGACLAAHLWQLGPLSPPPLLACTAARAQALRIIGHGCRQQRATARPSPGKLTASPLGPAHSPACASSAAWLAPAIQAARAAWRCPPPAAVCGAAQAEGPQAPGLQPAAQKWRRAPPARSTLSNNSVVESTRGGQRHQTPPLADVQSACGRPHTVHRHHPEPPKNMCTRAHATRCTPSLRQLRICRSSQALGPPPRHPDTQPWGRARRAPPCTRPGGGGEAAPALQQRRAVQLQGGRPGRAPAPAALNQLGAASLWCAGSPQGGTPAARAPCSAPRRAAAPAWPRCPPARRPARRAAS
jgi:hypothetical protein